MQKTSKTIIFTGGGTGGHIYPGLAVAQAVKQIDPTISIVFVGADRPLDKSILLKIGYPYHLLPIGPLNVSSFSKKIITFLGIPLAFLKGFLLLLKLKPCLVIGFGGYASFPSLLAAWCLRIPFAVWEANAIPGLVTRTLGKRAKLIFLSFSDNENIFAKSKVHQLGTPTRFQAADVEKSKNFRILIFGGSSGARAINEIVYAFLKKVNDNESGYEIFRNIEFVHQIGNTDYNKFYDLYKNFTLRLDVREFIHNMPEELAKAHFVISRAGGSTIAEVAMSKKACLFVPLPWAADNHQVVNAKRLYDQGAALLVEQKDFTPERLKQVLEDVLKNPQKLKTLEEKVENFSYKNAATRIAETLLAYVK